MKVSVVRIGNSKGIRIPKPVLEQCRLGATAELEVRKDYFIVRPAKIVRSGWQEAFRGMAEKGDDALLDKGRLAARWDRSEWEW